jgi:toxin ParE1/3/4
MMRYQVRIGAEAERDLEAIYDYIAASDGVARAVAVLDALTQATESLEDFPQRGSRPRELVAAGFAEYRQLIRSSWHLFYRIEGKFVFVDLVADGRRDLRTLLAQRLLGA